MVFCKTLLIPQNRVLFKRFLDSILQKATKMKALQRDIKKDYTQESANM